MSQRFALISLVLLQAACDGADGKVDTAPTASPSMPASPTPSIVAPGGSSADMPSSTPSSEPTAPLNSGGSGGQPEPDSSVTAGSGGAVVQPSAGAGGSAGTSGGQPGNAGTGGLMAAAGNGGSGGASGGQGGMAPALDGEPFVFTVSTTGEVVAYRMNESDGSLTALVDTQVPGGYDHFLAMAPSSSTLFVVYDGGVTALAFDANAPSFTELDTTTTFGAGTHVAVDDTVERVVVAHYNEGAATTLPFDGSNFGMGVELAVGMNAHSAQFHPTNRHVYVPCLGSNHVAQYAFEPGASELMPATPPTVSVSGGPRHMAFHPQGEYAYVLSELSGELRVFAVEGGGSLGAELDLELLGDAGQKSASDVQVTPNGSHVYAVERSSQNMFHFDVAGDGTLTASGEPTALGAVVRSFAMDPAGQYLQVGDTSGNLTTFAIGSDGELTRGSQLNDLGNVHATLIRYLP